MLKTSGIFELIFLNMCIGVVADIIYHFVKCIFKIALIMNINNSSAWSLIAVREKNICFMVIFSLPVLQGA